MITINLTECTEEQLIAIISIAQTSPKAISDSDFTATLDQLRSLVGEEDAQAALKRLAFEQSLSRWNSRWNPT